MKENETFYSTLGLPSGAGQYLWEHYDKREICKFVSQIEILFNETDNGLIIDLISEHMKSKVTKYPKEYRSRFLNIVSAIRRNKIKQINLT